MDGEVNSMASIEWPASVFLVKIESVRKGSAGQHMVKPLLFNLFAELSFLLLAKPH